MSLDVAHFTPINRVEPVPSSSKAPHQPKCLPDIPVDVLRLIAENLDRASAFALTLTCKSLRDAGEIKVWETLDLTTGYDPESLEEASLDQDGSINRQRRVATIVRKRLLALKRHPFRIECVVGLRIEPSDGPSNSTAKSFIEIIKLVAPNLRRFSYLQIAWGDIEFVIRRSLSANFLLDELKKLSFPRVVELRLSLHESAALGELNCLLPPMPNLQTLEICASRLSYSSVGSWDVNAVTRLPKLKRLEVGHIDDQVDDMTLAVLPRLIQAAPNIEHVAIAGEWDPLSSDPTYVAARGLKKLKSLEIFTGALNGLGAVGRSGFETLEDLTVEDEDLDETNELNLEDLSMPRLRNLRRLAVMTSPRLPGPEYVSLGITPQPDYAGHIGPSFIRRLNRNPSLTQIQFVFDDNAFRSPYAVALDVPAAPLLTEPSTWEATGARGVLVRTYLNPSTQEQLVHLRALTRALEHPSAQSYVGARRAWRDFCNFRGRTIPLSILRGAYIEAGMDIDWIEPGREMEFGHRPDGWQVLEDWRDEVEDVSDVEYVDSDGESMDLADSDFSDDDEDEDEDEDESETEQTTDWADTDEDVDEDDPIGGWDVD